MTYNQTYATELEVFATEIIERIILCDLDMEKDDTGFYLKDNNITEFQLKSLSRKLYRTVIRLVAKDAQERIIETEIKIPCINKV